MCSLDIRPVLRPIYFQREVIMNVNTGKIGVFMFILSTIFYCDSANVGMRYVYTTPFYFYDKNTHYAKNISLNAIVALSEKTHTKTSTNL